MNACPSDKLSENFFRYEFRCKCGCGGDTVDVQLVQVLQDLREFFNASVEVTSGFRCPKYNTQIGGASNSQHKKGKAADIVVEGHTPDEVADVIDMRYPNCLGLGRYDTFTHVDVRMGFARWDNRT